MDELQIFKNNEFGEVRIIEKDGEPYFVGKDIAEILNYNEPHKAIERLVDEDDRIKYPIIDSLKRMQETYVINESGLYSLILSSKMPNAKKFRKWVTSEVLPSIRKHGGYIAGQEDMSDDELMAKAILMANSKIKELNSKNKQLMASNSELNVENTIMKPKADYFDELVDRNLLTNFRDTSKALNVKEKEFISFLLDKKYVYRDKKGKLRPHSQYIDDKLFELKETYNEKTQWSGYQTLITPKGRETFRLLYVDIAS